ncbi:glycosyltransferase family 4 protein [Kitasatospora sp. MAP5-34]|uniref:glycosyltransferase family 4 protein n=1 Tax=Kitasatospora sp. MAP5-34 TaxID=3035102 RepID=UPI002472FDC1|nr:glycosyltransferase family 4 protein [Kitasatospora sp. MAP5-34]MDH6574471.1 glycosyltransferase involved in cell wall biosynthesis/O-antigen/teichoic acid export membrane protein [Kitasatospora sp. MAP5-34]
MTTTPSTLTGEPAAPAEAAPTTARGQVPDRSVVLLTLSALLVGAGNYGLSLLLVHLLAPADYAVYAAAASVLLTVGILAGATVPWVLAREVAVTSNGSARRRRSVRACLRLACALSVLCAVAACGAVASYAGPGLLAAIAAACVAIWVNSAGAGYLQGRQDFGRLAVLRVTEVAVRIAAAVGAVLAGWGSAGAVGAFAVGAAVTSVAGLTAMRGDLTRRPVPPGESVGADEGHDVTVVTDVTDVVDVAGERRTGLWQQAAAIGGIQVLVCLLLTLDVVVGAAVRHGSAALAPYQSLLVLARIPLFLATALATVVFPRLAAKRPGTGSHEFRAMLRLHWTGNTAVTVVLATCPAPVLALVLPGPYAASAALLPPLALAGLAGATITLVATVFQAWGPVRPVVAVLGAACLLGGIAFACTAESPTRLAWSAAAITGATAVAVVTSARRRVSGLSPAAGAALPLTAGAAVACALFALRVHPVLWALGASAVLATAAVSLRPRRRRPGPYRVLHLGFEDPRRPGAGGGSVRTHEVNRRLAARDIEVTVLCAPWPGCTATVRDGVRYLPLPAHLGPLARSRFASQLAYFAAIVATLWWLTRRFDPDLVVEDFAAPFSSVCVPYLTRRPTVGLVQWLFAADKAREYKLPFHLVERSGLRSHTSLIAVSDDLAAELRTRNPAAHVTVVPNGLDPAAFTAQRVPAREDLLYLGRLETTSKGLDLLLRAYAQAAPRITADLLIAGDGPHARSARALSEQLGITHRVHWLGRVDGTARFDLLAGARLVCMPSRYETFGMVAAEALATATPVLAFDIPCLRTLVTDRVGVRVTPGDITAYAEALTHLANNPARCATLGAAGPDTVRHLDWDRITDTQLARYLEVLSVGE